jgi:hypothetical protein
MGIHGNHPYEDKKDFTDEFVVLLTVSMGRRRLSRSELEVFLEKAQHEP